MAPRFPDKPQVGNYVFLFGSHGVYGILLAAWPESPQRNRVYSAKQSPPLISSRGFSFLGGNFTIKQEGRWSRHCLNL